MEEKEWHLEMENQKMEKKLQENREILFGAAILSRINNMNIESLKTMDRDICNNKIEQYKGKQFCVGSLILLRQCIGTVMPVHHILKHFYNILFLYLYIVIHPCNGDNDAI